MWMHGWRTLPPLAAMCLAVAACSGGVAGQGSAPARASAPASRPAPAPSRSLSPAGRGSPGTVVPGTVVPGRPLPAPAALVPFLASAASGVWRPAGRPVRGVRAVYETTLVPPGGTQPAGIAWLDTGLLAARLYSGSVSPGGGPYRFTAPIAPAQAATLVAAFNGGFKMSQARGGYYTEGRVVDPLRAGAASLVIYADGSVDIGAWGSDVTMTRRVASVRQNLLPLVADGRPTPRAATARWLRAWGSTCGATSCSPAVPGIEHQWRSGLGITADGALVYVAGPALDPLQLAELLVRAGAVRGMQLDINPNWPVFVTYDPPAGTPAAPANGRKLLASTAQGPWTFFEASWARDFITMSARPGAG
jgi:Phosphodiester glycosidase